MPATRPSGGTSLARPSTPRLRTTTIRGSTPAATACATTSPDGLAGGQARERLAGQPHPDGRVEPPDRARPEFRPGREREPVTRHTLTAVRRRPGHRRRNGSVRPLWSTLL